MDEMDEMDEMEKMANKMEREREIFFLENIKCQVTLIFTSYFLHKTSNPRLVFSLIQEIFFSYFFFSLNRNKD